MALNSDLLWKGCWTTNIYKNEVYIGSAATSGQWYAIKYGPYNSINQSIYAQNGFDRIRIEDTDIYSWGMESPPDDPNSSQTGTGGSVPGLALGTYYYQYTYCRKEGTTVVIESNPSPSGVAVVIAATFKYGVNYFVYPSDPQITHYRLYRTLANGNDFYHVIDQEIATTGNYDNMADVNLGSEVPTDQERPPLGGAVVGPSYNGICFMVKDNNLYFSLAKRPEYWPTAYYIEVSPPELPGKCIVFYQGQPYYITAREIYLIQGTGPTTFFPVPLKAMTGTQSINGACAVSGHGIFHIASDGVYLFPGTAGVDRKVSQPQFDPIFRGETVNGMPGMTSATNSWIIQFGNKLYIGYVSSGYTYPTNCLCLNLDNMRASYYTWGIEIRTVTVDEVNNRLLAADNSGYLWVLEDKAVTADGGTAISWEVAPKEFTLQTRAHFPSYAKYDVDASESSGASVEIILDGEVHQNHGLTEKRNTRKRLIKTGNGERYSFRLHGSGPVSIYAVETA